MSFSSTPQSNLKRMFSPLLVVLPALALAGSVTAQNLLFDNARFVTHAGGGSGGADVSSLQSQPPASLSVFGFGAQTNLNNSLADNFSVRGDWTINEVELYIYQTGSTSMSTVTGVFVEFYNGDPSAGGIPVAGSPGLGWNLLTGASTNVWSNTYRAQDTTLLSTIRPIMRVRVALPTPIALTTGDYWLHFQVSGSLASGPFVPPLTVLDRRVTGHAKQRQGTTWVNLVSGPAPGFAQDVPFKLYGTYTPSSQTLAAFSDLGNASGAVGPHECWLTGVDAPVLGQTASMSMSAPGFDVSALAYSSATSVGTQLFLGNQQITLFLDLPSILLVEFVALNAGQATASIAIPNAPWLMGVDLSMQSVLFAWAGSVGATNAVTANIGSSATTGSAFFDAYSTLTNQELRNEIDWFREEIAWYDDSWLHGLLDPWGAKRKGFRRSIDARNESLKSRGRLPH